MTEIIGSCIKQATMPSLLTLGIKMCEVEITDYILVCKCQTKLYLADKDNYATRTTMSQYVPVSLVSNENLRDNTQPATMPP